MHHSLTERREELGGVTQCSINGYVEAWNWSSKVESSHLIMKAVGVLDSMQKGVMSVRMDSGTLNYATLRSPAQDKENEKNN
jgi:hypothetical protein